jgi:hypothetical protein
VPTAGIDYCETIPIAEAGAGLSTLTVGFEVQSPSGEPLPFNSVTVIDESTGAGQAIYNGSTLSWAPCTMASCHVSAVTPATLPVVLSTVQVLVLQVSPATGGTSPTGDIFIVIGTGTYSGETTQTLA